MMGYDGRMTPEMTPEILDFEKSPVRFGPRGPRNRSGNENAHLLDQFPAPGVPWGLISCPFGMGGMMGYDGV